MPWVLGLGLEDTYSCALQDRQPSSSLQGLVTFKDVTVDLS